MLHVHPDIVLVQLSKGLANHGVLVEPEVDQRLQHAQSTRQRQLPVPGTHTHAPRQPATRRATAAPPEHNEQ